MSGNELYWGPLSPLKEKLLTWLEMLQQKAEQPVTQNTVSSGFRGRREVVGSVGGGDQAVISHELLWGGPNHSRPAIGSCAADTARRPLFCSSPRNRGLTPRHPSQQSTPRKKVIILWWIGEEEKAL